MMPIIAIAAVALSPAQVAKPVLPSALPAPRAVRRIPGWIPGESSFVGLRAATPKILVLQTGNRIVALDRGVTVESVPWWEENQGISLPYQTIRADWNVWGSVAVQNGKPSASPLLLMERRIVYTRYDPKPHTDPQYETQTIIYGKGERNDVKWQFPAQATPPDTTISTVVQVLCAPVGGLLPLRINGSDTLTFLDTQTGIPVDAKSTEGKTVLSEAIRQNGSPLMQTGDKLYRLDTGVVLYKSPLGLGTGLAQNVPLGVSADRAFWQGGGDDGWTGHSAYPTYLTVIDENGKFSWVFPEAKERGYGEGGGALDPSLGSFVLTNTQTDGNAIAVVSVTRKLRSGGTLFGLQTRTGKLIWQRTLPDSIELAAQSRTSNGFFVLRSHKNAKTGAVESVYLDCLNAATGKTQKTWTLPIAVNHVAAMGDDLLVIDTNGLVRIYSCRKLLGK